MTELNQTGNTTERENESMIKSDESSDRFQSAKLSIKSKKKNVVKNSAKVKASAAGNVKKLQVRKSVVKPKSNQPPLKTILPPRKTKLPKNNPKTTMKKNIPKKCPKLLKRAMSMMCEPCNAMCDPSDRSRLVLDCNISTSTADSRSTEDQNKNTIPRASPSPLRKPEPNDLKLLLSIIASVETGSDDFNSNSKNPENKIEHLIRNLWKSDELLEKFLNSCSKNSPQQCCHQNPCDSCCKEINPCVALAQNFAQNICTPAPVEPCVCQPMCSEFVKPSQCRFVVTPCPPCCSRRSAEGKQSTTCCIKPCCSRKSPCIKNSACCSGRKSSKRSVPDADVKFKSRTWLLEQNQLLQRKLEKLRKQERNMYHVCCMEQEEQMSRAQASFQLWQFLMQSMVKALVESHPAVRAKESVCECRIQVLDFVDPLHPDKK